MKKTIPVIVVALLAIHCNKRIREIRAPGMVEGDIVTIKALSGGTLDRLEVSEGSQVQKGQKIAELNRDKIANALAELRIAEQEVANSEARTRQRQDFLKANIAYLQSQVQRFTRLEKSESVSGDQLERARLQLLEAQTSLSDLEKALEGFRIQREKIANKRETLELAGNDLVFSSPVKGEILELFVSSGETVLPGTVIAEILDRTSLYIEAFIEEREIGRLRLGGQAVILIDGLEDRPLTGEITHFGKKAEFSPKYILSEQERQALLYQVKIRTRDSTGALKIGMPVTIVFPLP